MVMLDKKTLLRKQVDSDSESEDYFITCLKRAREVTESNESLQESIDRFLNKVAEEKE